MTRNTKTKLTVTEILKSTKAPLTLNEIFEETKKTFPKISYSTVFRIINRFLSEGKTLKVDWRERGSSFEWAGRPHHHHIVCEECDGIVDLNDQDLEFSAQKLSKSSGFLIKSHTIELSGICEPCQKGSTL